MKVVFNALARDINPGEKLLVSNNTLYVESRNTFFLVRFFRWIRGQYNQTNIHTKICNIANNALNNPNAYSKNQWEKLQKNLDHVYDNYTQANFRFITYEVIRRVAAQMVQFMNPAPQQKPAEEPYAYGAPPKGYKIEDYGPDVIPGYNKADFDRAQEPAAPPVVVVLEPAPVEVEDEVEIDEELKGRWFEALEEDEGCESEPLNQFIDGPFASHLSTPQGILKWAFPEVKIELKKYDPNKDEKEPATAVVIADILNALKIQTPEACMKLGLEPTLDAFAVYFAENEDKLVEAINKLAFIAKP